MSSSTSRSSSAVTSDAGSLHPLACSPPAEPHHMSPCHADAISSTCALRDMVLDLAERHGGGLFGNRRRDARRVIGAAGARSSWSRGLRGFFATAQRIRMLASAPARATACVFLLAFALNFRACVHGMSKWVGSAGMRGPRAVKAARNRVQCCLSVVVG